MPRIHHQAGKLAVRWRPAVPPRTVGCLRDEAVRYLVDVSVELLEMDAVRTSIGHIGKEAAGNSRWISKFHCWTYPYFCTVYAVAEKFVALTPYCETLG